ncbi:MAG: precorrin-6y C5,15-methyltransferase (decarboxylating) subunit CbiE [Lachnospiraceae bacterium]|nr:precorrin-6y C5,15-methyltransferase (decarboxylating) subunit CbiE [Lachnospiraceae bacterium]
MAEVIIFGGTTEGRELAEYASGHGIGAMVSVAGTYGSQVLGEPEGITVRQGPMDAGEMEGWFVREQPELVLDATHPHAVLVTEHVRSVCGKLGIAYRRVLRDRGPEQCQEPPQVLQGSGNLRQPEEGQQTEGRGEIVWVDTAREAARAVNRNDRPVLLTTGSKELGIFLDGVRDPGRIFARVLPDSRVLAACEALGMQGSHVIAMQGPFSVEMNCALIRMTGAGWLVTKESGKRGGFAKKLKAAGICGIRTVVITRPGDVEGISLERAKSILDQFLGKRSLALVGMGMGGGSQLTAEAREVLSRAQAVLGAKRMLEDVKDLAGQARLVPYYRGEDIADWLEAHPECMRAVAVYSGDTGFHSGSASLLKAMEQKTSCNRQPTSCQKPQENGDGPWEIRVFPGISTVSCLCARFRISYEDLYLASAHGQVCAAEELVRQHRRVFLLLGGGGDLAQICQRLCESGYGKTRVMAGVRLGYADEQLLAGKAEEFCRQRTEALAAVILEYAGSGRREDAG